jgi:hypothetical protein
MRVGSSDDHENESDLKGVSRSPKEQDKKREEKSASHKVVQRGGHLSQKRLSYNIISVVPSSPPRLAAPGSGKAHARTYRRSESIEAALSPIYLFNPFTTLSLSLLGLQPFGSSA